MGNCLVGSIKIIVSIIGMLLAVVVVGIGLAFFALPVLIIVAIALFLGAIMGV